jgi:CHAT domain-containing protein/WD40 repeat protein
MGSGGDAGSTYAEFRLRIERVSKRVYRIEASGPSGQAESTFKLPFSDLELENFVLKVRGTRQGVRSLESPEMDLAKTFGTKLFDALFDADIRSLYRSSTVEANNAGQGLRITLALSSAPELLRVPWEYLYDKPLFPSTDRRTPIIRYLDLPKPIKPFKIQLPLRILAIVSAPSDVPAIDGAQERAKLESALAPLLANGSVEIDWLEDANLSALYKLLSKRDRADYHILHFIGHGGYANEANEGVLLFEGKDGRRQNETGDKLGAILHGEDSLRLAVLNSCEGARASLNDPFSSVATSLIEYEIPAVIGMQFEITDRAAILFSGEFYAALADGRAVDEALSQARMAIFADNNDIEWGTPVLFMRVTDGRLFDVQAPAAETATDLEAKADAERKRIEHEAAVAAEAEAAQKRFEAEAAAKAAADAAAEAERQRLEQEAAASAEKQRLEQESAAAAEKQRLEQEAAMAAAAQQRLEQEAAAAAEAERQRLAHEAAAAEQQRLAQEATAPAEQQRLAQEAAAAAEAERQRLAGMPGAERSKWKEAETAMQAQQAKAAKPGRARIAVIGGVVVAAVVAVILALLPNVGTTISVSADPGGAPGVVRVTGDGFQAGETVNLEIATILVETAVAAEDGRIDQTARIPPGETSPVLVTAIGQSSQHVAFAAFDFAAAATESVQPTDGQATPSDATVTLPPVIESKIVFYSNFDASSDQTDTEIYLLDPDGWEVSIPLTDNSDEDTFPTWSPDHTQIAFARAPRGGASRDLWIMDADGGNQRPLIEDSADQWFPAWAPDGTIAYVQGSEIWTVRAGESPRLLAAPPAGTSFRSPAWSADGSVLAVWGDAEEAGNYDLYVIVDQAGNWLRLTTDPEVDRNATWSPDGSTLAFVRDVDGSLETRKDNDIYLLDVATRTVTMRLTNDNDAQDGNPVWSPQGDRIVYYRSSGSGYHLRIIDPDGSDSDDLMEGRPGLNLDPNWR